MKTLKILFEIALLPGRAIQWINYMFPQKGEIFTSARRRNSIIFRIIYSIIGWATIFILITNYNNSKEPSPTPHSTPTTSNIKQATNRPQKEFDSNTDLKTKKRNKQLNKRSNFLSNHENIHHTPINRNTRSIRRS